MAAASAILSKISKKIKVAYRSEMARNAIESEFRTSKMGAGSHFVTKMKTKIPYWSKMARNAIKSEFRTSKMGAGGHFVKKIQKIKFILIWNGQKCDRKWFSDFQNGRQQPLCQIWNGQKCDQTWISDIQNGRRRPLCKKFQNINKFHSDLKWPEMWSKVIFEHPKWPTAAILSKISKRNSVLI